MELFTVEKLTKKFGKKVVLDNITINFKEDTTVIVGLNGSGKTVFLNSITGILNIDSGTIAIDGFKPDSKEFKERIFYIPSDFYLPEYMTGKEYAYFIMSRYTKSSYQLFIEIIKLLDMSNYLDKPLESYSFGMKKKIQLAIMFATPTPYIIADEIFSGLDLETSIIIQELFFKIIGKRKIILVSHEKNIIAKFSDNILIISDGTLTKYRQDPNLIDDFIKRGEQIDDKTKYIKQLFDSL